MGYIEKHLISGENVLYKTRLHSIAIAGPLLTGIVLILLSFVCFYESSANAQNAESNTQLFTIAGVALLVIGVLTIFLAILKRNATEMAVTNKRILIKSGFFSRRTIELLLSRVESIVITEPFLGRMLGYGTVIIRGTGGTPEPFPRIARPTEFRRVVQEQIEAGEGAMPHTGTSPRSVGV